LVLQHFLAASIWQLLQFPLEEMPSIDSAVTGQDCALVGQEEADRTQATMAIVPFRKGRGKPNASALFEKYLSAHAGKSAEQRIAAIKERCEQVDARLTEEAQVVSSRDGDVPTENDARRELEEENARVAAAIGEELSAALAFHDVKVKQQCFAKVVGRKREQMLEAQKKWAMIQVVQENQAAIEKLQQQRADALRLVQEAKQSLMEHRLQEKKILEEAKRGIAASQMRIGKKRMATTGKEDMEEGVAGVEAKFGVLASAADTGAAPSPAKVAKLDQGDCHTSDANAADLDDGVRASGA